MCLTFGMLKECSLFFFPVNDLNTTNLSTHVWARIWSRKWKWTALWTRTKVYICILSLFAKYYTHYILLFTTINYFLLQLLSVLLMLLPTSVIFFPELHHFLCEIILNLFIFNTCFSIQDFWKTKTQTDLHNDCPEAQKTQNHQLLALEQYILHFQKKRKKFLCFWSRRRTRHGNQTRSLLCSHKR